MAASLFDTHCHLTFPELLGDSDRLVAEAAEAGVTRILTVACGVREIAPALDLAGKHAGVYVAAGIHPHEAAGCDEAWLAALAEAWQHPKMAACGEMGLDYHYDFSPRDVQRAVFHRQLELAAAAGRPVVVHCREAHDDVVGILREHGLVGRPVVFHCFSGTAAQAAQLRSFGWHVSFTGVITFRKAVQQREACRQTPPSVLMFETDAPYLSPEPVRGMRPNVPANLVHTVRFAAELHGMPFEELAESSTRQALRFYGLEGR